MVEPSDHTQTTHIAPDMAEAPSFGGQTDAVAPRVNIECFCSTAAFATTMREAMSDRRMARARTNIAMGGVAQAAKRFETEDTPHVLIVESIDPGFGMFAELESLAEVCSPETNVIVVGPSNDVTIYRELMRQGVSEYLVAPCSPMQMIEAIGSIYAGPEAAPLAKMISVYGVKGGVGSSVIAHNIAWTIANRAKRETILVDLDIEFGTAALDFNVESKSSVADALADIDRLDDVKLARILHSHTNALKLLPAPAAIHAGVSTAPEHMLSLIDTVRHAADVVVMDTPHLWSEGVKTTLTQSNEILLVATPDLACLRNLKSIYDWLSSERRNDTPPRIVLNQVGMQKRPEIPTKDFAEIVGAPIDLEVSFDAALFGAALNNGQMLSEVSSSNKTVGQIDRFVDTLLGLKSAPAPATSKVASLLSGLELPSMLKQAAKRS